MLGMRLRGLLKCMNKNEEKISIETRKTANLILERNEQKGI